MDADQELLGPWSRDGDAGEGEWFLDCLRALACEASRKVFL